MRRAGLLLGAVVASCAGSPPGPVSRAPPGFWDHWGDGAAELDRYALTIPRYGELRSGVATLVFVTEDFTRATRVKSDGGHGDEFPVIKLNDVRDFQTGIYDYNVLTSTFVPLDGSGPLGLPTKVSISVQEWCGNVYEQLIVDPERIRRTRHSYFDGEADQADELAVPPGGVLADALPVLVRGLAGDLVAPGGSREVTVLGDLLTARLTHTPEAWATGTLTRGAPEAVTVPAGTFDAEPVTLVVGDLVATWWVETAAPRRIVRWTRSTGEEGRLQGSIRTPYWREHAEGDEALLSGLAPP